MRAVTVQDFAISSITSTASRKLASFPPSVRGMSYLGSRPPPAPPRYPMGTVRHGQWLRHAGGPRFAKTRGRALVGLFQWGKESIPCRKIESPRAPAEYKLTSR